MDISQANAKANDAFRAMLKAYFGAGKVWTWHEVEAYRNAERDLDLAAAVTEFDAIQSEDHDFHLNVREPHDLCSGCKRDFTATGRLRRTVTR
jgi:hypothetical protein